MTGQPATTRPKAACVVPYTAEGQRGTVLRVRRGGEHWREMSDFLKAWRRVCTDSTWLTQVQLHILFTLVPRKLPDLPCILVNNNIKLYNIYLKQLLQEHDSCLNQELPVPGNAASPAKWCPAKAGIPESRADTRGPTTGHEVVSSGKLTITPACGDSTQHKNSTFTNK